MSWLNLCFAPPRGTRDLLPPESARRRQLVRVFADLAERTGFGLLESPIFEDLGVFQRLGADNDVVTKELFEFFDKGDPPPPPGSSPRVDGQRVPGVRRAPADAAVEDLVLGPAVPLRAAPGRPLPAVRPGRVWRPLVPTTPTPMWR